MAQEAIWPGSGSAITTVRNSTPFGQKFTEFSVYF